MKQRLAPTGNAARRLLLGLCSGLFISAAAGESLTRPASARAGGAPPQAVTLPLKVCVYDEAAGRRVPVPPSLFNSPSTVKQPTNDGCYANPSVTLKLNQVYFLAAVSEGRTAFKDFTVAADDAGKEKLLELRLPKKGGENVAQIEICANDERGNALPVSEVKPTGAEGGLAQVTAADPNCYRVSSAAASEYKLSLTARGTHDPTPFSHTELRIVGSVLVLITLIGFALATYLLLRLHWLSPLSARQETIEKLDKSVGVLSGLTPTIGTKVDDLHALVAALPEQMRPAAKGQTDGTGPSDAHAAAPGAPARHQTKPAAATQPPPPPPAETPRQNFISEDAKRKYKDFSGGLTVEHFYLMPSGSSTATGTVEDMRVELIEQSKGTYVGFRSAAREGEAMVFPMPNVHFTQETFKALFPDLTAQDYASGAIEPRMAVNTQGKVWRVV